VDLVVSLQQIGGGYISGDKDIARRMVYVRGELKEFILMLHNGIIISALYLQGCKGYVSTMGTLI
jgi:hypothetical protein